MDDANTYFRKVNGVRPSELTFPEPVPTFQHDRPIGPHPPSFAERLESEAPILKSMFGVGRRAADWAAKHPMNNPKQIDRVSRRAGRGNERNVEFSDFLPPADMGVGMSFEEMAYGAPPRKHNPGRKKRRRE